MRISTLVFWTLATIFLPGCDGITDLLPQSTVEPPSTEWSAMLAAINIIRAEGQTCGNDYYSPAEPLAWSGALESAARRHTEDMAEHEYFDHVGRDGSTVGDRVSREGYAWRSVGENIARYQDSVAEVVQDWAESPGHCANLMNPGFVEMGAAEENLYWTHVLGSPR